MQPWYSRQELVVNAASSGSHGLVSVVQPPNDADLLELLYSYVADEAELKKILVTNPAKLFGYKD